MLYETVTRLSYAESGNNANRACHPKRYETMNRHMEMLAHNEDLRKVYEMFSSLIISAHHKK
jgi:hypothetical protein